MRKAAFQVCRSLKIREELFVADGLRRGAVGIAVVIHQFGLFQNAALHHAVTAGINPLVKKGAVAAGQAETE